MGWPSVQGYKDGSEVVADVLNKPIGQLAERTEYLKRLLEMKDQTKVVVDAEVTQPAGTTGIGVPSVGQPVYRIPGTGAYAKAAALVSESEWFYADESAMAVGIVGKRDTSSGTKATIVLYGFMDFGSEGIAASDVITDTAPVSGRYYLSPVYGKLTANPGGPVIYVCDCRIAKIGGTYRVLSMLVSPQYRDTGESHIHRSFVVSGVPQGGYAVKGSAVYETSMIWHKNAVPTTNAKKPTAGLSVGGVWTSDRDITYTLWLEQKGTETTGWDKFKLMWTAAGDISTGDSSGSVTSLALDSDSSGLRTGFVQLGSHGTMVRFILSSASVTPLSLVGRTWEISMPNAGRGWELTSVASGKGTYRLNLGMYPSMSRYVPPVPSNASALTVDGTEPLGPVFGSKKQWDIEAANSDGGPWLMWIGGEVAGVSATAPFKWVSDIALATERNIVLHVNRMRVGPTGFVTSLQAAEGSPLKITSAQTGDLAVQGALQVDMDVDFRTSEEDVAGNQVIKAIEGSTFKTGPVVERVVAGPGLSVMPESGQGTVTVAVSNAVYSGDFETIALKNAKQDLAGGVFPYTKLLKWLNSSGNVNSGFTAKFRVPDHIRYRENGYKVVVSASVFGEEASSASIAAFKLKNYVLADHSCALNLPSGYVEPPVGQISAPKEGVSSVVHVQMPSGYSAFDPILIHGFSTSDVPNMTQRQQVDSLLLKYNDGTSVKDVVVYPGYFVGLSIDRCDITGTGTWYTAPLGFLSLRWNLIEA